MPSAAGIAYGPVSHAIFDMDGLLLDTEDLYKSVIDSIAEEYGSEYTHEINMKIMGTTAQDTARIAVQEMKLPITAEEFGDLYRDRCDVALRNPKLCVGVDKLVRHLNKNNIPMAIATSSSSRSVEIKTSNLREFFSQFHHIVMGSSDPEVKRGKPQPDIFQVCLSRFPDSPRPEECLVFEDAPNGVLGAIRAGMQCVMIPDRRTDRSLCKHATLVIDSAEDFKPEAFGLPPY